MGRSKRPQAKRQTRLAFTPVASLSPAAQWSPGSGSEKHATMRYKDPSSSSISSKPIPRTPAIFRSAKPLQTESKSSDEEEPVNMPRSGRKPTRRAIVEDESDSDVIVTSSPTKRKRRNTSGPETTSLRNGTRVEHNRPDVEAENESDSDAIVASSPTKRRRRNTSEPKSMTISLQNGTRAGQDRLGVGEGDESDSDAIVTSSPTKRRRRNPSEPKGKAASPRNGTRDEQDRLDIEEDLEILQDSATMKSRTRGKPANLARLKRQEQLEALKRKRAKEVSPEIIASSEDESDNETQENGGASEGEDESTDDEEPWYGSGDEKDSDDEPPPPEDLDKYDEDFVDDDDGDGTLGVPADQVDMPFEFSRHRYKRLRDHFKDVVEWMVHNKLNPAFPRDDLVYQAAFAKVNDEVTGLAGSQLVSAAWNLDFKRALEARPAIEVTSYPIIENHPCDACNKSGHPASFDIKFDGKPYLLETLEPVSDTDDSNSDEDSDEEENGPGNTNRDGDPIPDASTHFYLGRHCKAKATMAHTLLHWRYHLNEWIVDYLRKKGVFTDSKIVERERWTHKRRTKYANEVVDSMEEAREIEKLWRDFNINVKAARETKESRW